MSECRANKRTGTLVGLSLLAVGVVAGLAYGAMPGSNGVIQCPKGFTPLQWNQQGVKGVEAI